MALYYGPSLRRILDRFPSLRYPLWLLETLPLLVFWGVSGSVSPERASRMGSWLLERVGPRLRKHRHVLRNLRVAFPDRPADWTDGVARQVWGTLGAVMAEYPHLHTICHAEGAERLEVVVSDAIQSIRAHKPMVFVTAHVANLEMVPGTLVARLGLLGAVVYGPQENPLADRLVQHFRKALGCALVSKDASMRQLVRELREGRSLGFAVDQRVDGSPLVPFFGVPAATAVSPARLALRFGCELVPVRVERLPATRFRVTLAGPVGVPPQGSDEEKALQMTGTLNALFESWIRERPGEWVCTKRRWSQAEVRRQKAAADPAGPWPPPSLPAG